MKRLFATMLLVSLAAACNDSPSEPESPVKTLQVTDVVVGTGAEATAGKSITVHYTGWLYDDNTADHHGAKFASSRDTNTPFTFPLGTSYVIEGWDQGIVGMKVGGQRTLIIPPDLAYGSNGNGPIPPNAALVFDIELLSVQ